MLSSSKGTAVSNNENKNDGTLNNPKFLEYRVMKDKFIAQYWRTLRFRCNTKFIDKIITTKDLTAKEKYLLLMECCYLEEGGATFMGTVNFAINLYANAKTINQYFLFLIELHKGGILITELVNLLIGRLSSVDSYILGQKLRADSLVSYYNLVKYTIEDGAEVNDALSLCAPNIYGYYDSNATNIYLDCLEKLRNKAADPVKIIELIRHLLPHIKKINDEKTTQRVLILFKSLCAEKNLHDDVVQALETPVTYNKEIFSLSIVFSRQYSALQQLFDLYDTLLDNGYLESRMLAHFAKLKLDSEFSFSHAIAIHANSTLVLRYVSIVVRCHKHDVSAAAKLMLSLNKKDGHTFISLIKGFQNRETVGAAAIELIREGLLIDRELALLKSYYDIIFEFVNKLPAQVQISIRQDINNENRLLGQFFRSTKSDKILEKNKKLLAQLLAKEGQELNNLASSVHNDEEKATSVKMSLQVGGTHLFSAKYDKETSQPDKSDIVDLKSNNSQIVNKS